MRLKRRHRLGLTYAYLLAWASGVTLFILSHWVRQETAFGVGPWPYERWVRIAHVALTYALVLGLGSLITSHIVPGLKRSNRRVSGLAVTSYAAVLIASAVWVLYADNDAGRINWPAWVHALLGLGTPVLLAVHLRRTLGEQRRAWQGRGRGQHRLPGGRRRPGRFGLGGVSRTD